MVTKDLLIDVVAKRLGIAKKQAADFVEAFLSGVIDALKRGEEVSLSGFGSFKVGMRKARKGVNPRTGAAIDIPEMKVPKFRPAKGLKDTVR